MALIWNLKDGQKQDNIGVGTRALSIEDSRYKDTKMRLMWYILGKKKRENQGGPVQVARGWGMHRGEAGVGCVTFSLGFYLVWDPQVPYIQSSHQLISPLLSLLYNYFWIPYAQIFQIAPPSVGCQLPFSSFVFHFIQYISFNYSSMYSFIQI